MQPANDNVSPNEEVFEKLARGFLYAEILAAQNKEAGYNGHCISTEIESINLFIKFV